MSSPAAPAAQDPGAAFRTSSGIEVRRVYGAAGEGGVPTQDPSWEASHLGRAGQAPYTRGIHRTMYRGRHWTMRQYAGFGTAGETNARFKTLLREGQTGLSTAFDLPPQLGLDADDPRSRGEVGRVGVHVGNLADMQALFEDIPLSEVSTSLTINATAPMLLALYVAVARRRRLGPETLRGTLQNDILKEFIARGTYIFPPEASLRLACDAVEHATRRLPLFHPISISGYHIREAGSSAAQEIAFTFANAEVYVRALLGRGLGVDEFGPRLTFFFGCHNHMLEEVAKFRAARRVWHRLMSEGYGAKDPKTLALKFHVQTCGSTLTQQQPLNNVVRVALQAMAAALGGAQSLHTNSYDEALALPSEEAAVLALRTQQILAHETGVADCADPVGGSYAVEALTDELEARVWGILGRVRAAGGMLAAIASGFPQAEIHEEAYRTQLDIEQGRRQVVGVNAYRDDPSPGRACGRARRRGATAAAAGGGLLKVSPRVEAAQRRRLEAFRRSRDGARAGQAVAALKDAAADPRENLFPHILAAAEAQATLGEVFGALRAVFGEHVPASWSPAGAAARPGAGGS